MNFIEIIDKKRLSGVHTQGEISWIVSQVMAGEIPDYQTSAWLMASCINGLNLDETTWLTDAFVQSGKVLDLSEISRVVVDKHSTGGVGDKTTLILVPLLAACGVTVAKLSGRGLGFTGGTIDKLEAIPGFEVALDNQRFLNQLKETGMAISSQTSDLAPADGKIYALRDVTATVSSIPLIAASVVSKKIAAGAQVIVLDIKFGEGAFMKGLEDARNLAETCREVGKRLGRTILTLISSMEQPLGYAVGNSLEVMESAKLLNGQEACDDLKNLCLKLAGMALVGANKFSTLEEAEKEACSKIEDGSAFKKFQELVNAQGGIVDALEDFSCLPQPERITLFPAPKSGYIQKISALKIAKAAKAVGAGRQTKDSPIHLGAGVLLHKRVGEMIEEGQTLVELYVGNNQGHGEAMTILEEAFEISPTQPEPLKLIDSLYLEEAAISN